MRPYKRVMQAVTTALRARADLVAILGSPYRIRRRTGIANVPGVEWVLIADSEDENTAPIEVQFSIFAENADQLEEIDRILHEELHHGHDVVIGGVRMLARYLIGRSVEDPAEDVLHRAVDYRFTLARED